MKFSDVINNRELALLIWLIPVFLLFLFLNKDFRKSIWQLIKLLYKWKMLLQRLITIGYIVIIICILYYLNYWNWILLKEAILWYIFSSMKGIYDSLTSRDQVFALKKFLLDSLKIIILISFIANSYTFSLIAEIIIFPFLLIIAILKENFSGKEEYKSIHSFFEFIIIIGGIGILLNSVYLIKVNIETFGTYLTLEKFILPVILTIGYLPILFGLIIISNYEQIFIRFIHRDAAPDVKRYAKIKIIWFCKLSIFKQKEILTTKKYYLMHVNSKLKVNKLLEEIELYTLFPDRVKTDQGYNMLKMTYKDFE